LIQIIRAEYFLINFKLFYKSGSPVYDCVIGIDIMGKIPELNPIPEDLMASLELKEGENSTNTSREQRKKSEKDFPGVILGWEAIAALTKK